MFRRLQWVLSVFYLKSLLDAICGAKPLLQQCLPPGDRDWVVVLCLAGGYSPLSLSPATTLSRSRSMSGLENIGGGVP